MDLGLGPGTAVTAVGRSGVSYNSDYSVQVLILSVLQLILGPW